MKKLISVLSVLAVLVVLTSAGIFGYTKYKEMELKQENLQSQLDDKNDESANNEDSYSNQEKVNADEAQTQEINSTEENVSDEQQVTRDNVFDYAIAAVNEVGDADLLNFQEPEYNGSEWTINANNKSGAGANTIVVKDDGTVQIWNGPKTSMDHETKIEL
ncbi:hypothetical protein [Staphylococcus haemolyticus]|uniref:hypothetical protein n=1 Tax=Staphylococcus haemolyticus TaxID=1283 RepID=UPI001F0AFFFB|nr:hypothetical protein [Staphylococcus haemolyticus]MCH4364026.1 hypothetical protein [Staphylococcus haemolyticus]